MKKILCLLITLSLLGCTKTEPIQNDNQIGCDVTSTCDEGEKADMSGYESFMETDHNYIDVTMSDVNEMFKNKETFVAYFGFSTCPWCIEILPLLNQAAQESEMNVQYVNIRSDGVEKENDIRVDTNKDYLEFVEIVKDTLGTTEDGTKRLFVPFVYFVKDGEIVDYREGTFENHDAKERKMTSEEMVELTDIYRTGFDKLKK